MVAEPLIPGGYILLSKKIIESEIWRKPPLYLKVWIYLLSRAQYSDYKNLKRGQLWVSYQEIIDSCAWKVGVRTEKPTKDQIFNILEWFRNPDFEGSTKATAKATTKATMITTMKATKGMLITIENFNVYQDFKNYESNSESNDESNSESNGTSNRIKKENNNIYIYIGNLPDGKLKERLIDFVNMREEIKKPLTEKGFEILVQKLDTIGKTEGEKIQILEYSIIKNLPDIYPLSNKSVDKPVDKLLTSGKKSKNNKFHNFEGKMQNYSEAALEDIAREKTEKKLNKLRGGATGEN